MTLAVVWFILIAVLWTVYLVLEGFDFGVGMLLPILGQSRNDRNVMIRTFGPHWDGNEVWLLTAGGATFAAMPLWYATMFSGMYFALFLLLVLLIVRITAIEWRSSIKSEKWVDTWDWLLTVSSYGAPLVLGVAFSNLVAGMIIEAQQVTVVDGSLQPTTVAPGEVAGLMDSGTIVFNMTGGFWALFTPYSILGGLVIVAISFSLGAQFLSLRTEDALLQRARAISGPASVVAVALAAIWVIWGQLAYSTNMFSWIPLLIAAVALIAAAAFSQPGLRNEMNAFIASSIGIAGAVAWVFSSMAPYVMKSKVEGAEEAYSLTMEWAASSQPTLIIMLVVALVLVPVVIGYTIWSYWVMRGRITGKQVEGLSGLLPDSVRPKANFLSGKSY